MRVVEGATDDHRSTRRVADDVVAAATVLVAIVGLFIVTGAAAGRQVRQEPDEESQTISGEVVEMMCYQRMGDDALGDRHAECALKCATSGTDLAILSPEGLFIVTGAAAGTDQLFSFIAKTIRATHLATVGDTDGGQTIVAVTLKVLRPTPRRSSRMRRPTLKHPVMMVEEVTGS